MKEFSGRGDRDMERHQERRRQGIAFLQEATMIVRFSVRRRIGKRRGVTMTSCRKEETGIPVIRIRNKKPEIAIRRNKGIKKIGIGIRIEIGRVIRREQENRRKEKTGRRTRPEGGTRESGKGNKKTERGSGRGRELGKRVSEIGKERRLGRSDESWREMRRMDKIMRGRGGGEKNLMKGKGSGPTCIEKEVQMYTGKVMTTNLRPRRKSSHLKLTMQIKTKIAFNLNRWKLNPL